MIIALAILIAAIVLYVFVVRPCIREMPWCDPFFDWIEPIEAALWAKSKTVLVARLAWVPSAILLLHDTVAASAFDATPILSRLFHSIPDDIRPLAITAAVGVYGAVVEWLRRRTVEPIDAKE